MMLRLVCAVSLLLTTLPMTVGAATDRYVAPHGVDTGDCDRDSADGDEGAACKTINYGITRMSDGDTLLVADGVYTATGSCSVGGISARTCISGKDCPTHGCTLRAENPGGARLANGTIALGVVNSDGWTIEGLEIGSPSTGVQACLWSSGSDRLTVREVNCWTTNTSGDSLSRYWINNGDNVLFERIRVDQQLSTQCTNEGEMENHAIALKDVRGFVLHQSYLGHQNQIMGMNNVEDLVINRNTFEHFWEHGIGMVDCFNCLIENNVFKGDTRPECHDYIVQGGGSASRILDMYCAKDVTFRNNTIVGHDYAWRNIVNTYCTNAECNFGSSGPCRGGKGGNPAAGKPEGWDCHYENVEIYNNLVYDTYGSSNGQFSQLCSPNVHGIEMDYNIYDDGLGYQLPGNGSNHRLWECGGQVFGPSEFVDYQAASCWGQGSGAVDGHSYYNHPSVVPAFADYEGSLYQPSNSSAGQVDRGIGTDTLPCPTEDFEGRPRTDGECDIGAFELQKLDNDCSDGFCRIECNEGRYEAAIDACNARGGGCLITFNCRDLEIPLYSWDAGGHASVAKKFTTDHNVIDGEDRNLTFYYAGSEPCHFDSVGPGFIYLHGSHNTVKNLSLRDFPESIQMSSSSSPSFENQIINVTFLSACDDAISLLHADASGHLVKGSTFIGAPDKNMQLTRGSITLEGNTFINTVKAFMTQNTTHVVARNNVMKTDSSISTPSGQSDECEYAAYVRDDSVVIFEDNYVEGCKRGLLYEGNSQGIVRNNVLIGNARGGVRAIDSARVSFEGNYASGNGFGSGSLPYGGGFLVANSAQGDAGGGSLTIDGQLVSSAGLNTLVGNFPVGGLVNQRSGYTLKAENNFWDHDTVVNVLANDVTGSVDVDPLGGGASGPVCTDSDGDSYSPDGGSCGPVDCNDASSTVHPGASDLCDNGIDEDCSGADSTCSTGGGDTYEAETFSLSGYQVESNSYYSAGQGIRIISGNSTGTATTSFSGPSGTYEVEIHYLIESDGQPRMELAIGSTLVGSFTYALRTDQPSGLLANTYSNVSIQAGDLITLTGTKDSGAWARVDRLVFALIDSGEPEPACGSDAECQDGNACTIDRCEPSVGCLHDPIADGTPCEDGDVCTLGDSCQAGLCSSGSELTCEDGNPCTTDACESASGCVSTPVPNGTTCPEGVCQAGFCVADDPGTEDPGSDPDRLGRDRYVSTSGVDAGDCDKDSGDGDSGQVCRTANYAIGRMVDGDRLRIAPGTYTDTLSYACPRRSGSFHVVIDRDCPSLGCTIEVDGSSRSAVFRSEETGVCIGNADGWTVRGLQFETSLAAVNYGGNDLVYEDVAFLYNDTSNGTSFWLENGDNLRLSRVTLDNRVGCRIHNDGQGVFVFRNVSNLIVEDSYIGHDNHTGSISHGATGVILRRNVFEQFSEHGITFTNSPHGILIENNLFLGDPECGEFWNTCAGGANEGAWCANDGACPGSYCINRTGPRLIDIYEVSDLTVRNNTIAGHGVMWQNVFLSYGDIQCSISSISCNRSNLKVYNNLMYDILPYKSASNDNWLQMGSGSYTTQSDLAFDGNLYFQGPDDWNCSPSSNCGHSWAEYQGCSCWDGTANMDPHGLNVEPSFIDYAGRDYRAAAGAAQIDAGVDVLGTGAWPDGRACALDDFDGNPRADGACDIGAFEFGASLCNNDGIKNAGEACDGSDLGGADCTTLGQGFTGGTLACNSSCSFDTSGCTLPVCTDEDGDGYSVEGDSCGPVDCNDGNVDVHPGAPELCGNGVDEDCSGADLVCSIETDYEAESFTRSNYDLESHSMYSNGQGIRVLTGTGTATTPFLGASGTYDVELYYIVEGDGQPTLEFSIGPNVLDSFTYELWASGEPSLRTRTYTQVSVQSGDMITLVGTVHSGAHARVDKVVFTLVEPGGPEPVCGSDAECNDGNTCTVDWCEPGTGCENDPITDGTPCEDGDICTLGDSCQAGACASGSPLDCEDHNPCTLDVCESASGCVNATVQDGTVCAGGVCQAGSCVTEDPGSDDPGSDPDRLGRDRYVSLDGADVGDCDYDSSDGDAGNACRTLPYGIDQMSDGDTLLIADGTYDSGQVVAPTGCILTDAPTHIYLDRFDCPSGCTIRAENLTDPPAVTLVGSGGERSTAIYNRDSDGWTIQGIKFVTSRHILQCFADHTSYEGLVFEVDDSHGGGNGYVLDSEDVLITDSQFYVQGKSCAWTLCERSGGELGVCSGAFAFQGSRDLVLQDSYIGHFGKLFVIGPYYSASGDVRSARITMRRNELKHWRNHGIEINHDSSDILIENNIIGGIAACAPLMEINEAANPLATWGPRAVDLYEVQNLVVRNNLFAGHGYTPQSMANNYLTAGAGANESCPGGATGDNADGTGLCHPSGSTEPRNPAEPCTVDDDCSNAKDTCGRGFCNLENLKFYNNLVYDTLGRDGAGQRYFNFHYEHTGDPSVDAGVIRNIRVDGNLYHGATVDEWKCGSNVATFAEWQQLQCPEPGAQNPDVNGIYAAPSFVNYEGAVTATDYMPAGAGARQVDAGIGGVDPEGVARCASEDFFGNLRADGLCDIGPFEFEGAFVCGNGAREAGEACDGSDLGGADCTTLGQGFTGGALACTSSCGFDTSGCTLPVCTDQDGDGYSVEGGACGPVDCDDGNEDVHPGASELCGNGVDEDCSGADLVCSIETDYEAESFTRSNYDLESHSMYSNGEGIRVPSGTGTATTPFLGAGGSYDIELYYIVEGDGQPTLEFSVGSNVLDSFTYELWASGEPSLRTRTYAQVSVQSGDVVTLVGTVHSGAYARVDKVVFTLVEPGGPEPACSSDEACGDGNPCTADRCEPSVGCQHDAVADGTACDDGLACRTGEVCSGGFCGGGEPVDCSALGDACAVGVCEEGTGGCVVQPRAAGTPCEDGDPCTMGDTCQAGACTPGSALSCEDGDPCTVDTCERAAGCSSTAAPDGTVCGDGVCQAGVCVIEDPGSEDPGTDPDRLGRDRFVSPDGADTGDCDQDAADGDSGQRCRSINYAIGKMVAGDTLFVADGTYSEEYDCGDGESTVICLKNRDCTESEPCTIKAENPLGAVLLGLGSGGGRSSIYVRGSDYWTFEGLSLGTPTTSAGRSSCVYTTISNHLVFRDMECWRDRNNASGWSIVSSDQVLLDNVFFDYIPGEECLFTNVNPVSCAGSSDHMTVQDSTFRHIIAGDIHLCDNFTMKRSVIDTITSHVFIAKEADDILLENNIITFDFNNQNCLDYDAHQSSGDDVDRSKTNAIHTRLIDIYKSKNYVVRNNTIAMHGHGGHSFSTINNYSLKDQCGTVGGQCEVRNLKFYNNVVYDYSNGAFASFNKTAYDPDTGQPLNVFPGNNLFDGNLYFRGEDPPRWSCEGTSYYSLTEWQTQSADCPAFAEAQRLPDQHSHYVEPTFADYGGRDYRPLNVYSPQVNGGVKGLCDDQVTHCQADSDCSVGACGLADLQGVEYCASDDFDGSPRADGRCDIGAFEFQGPPVCNNNDVKESGEACDGADLGGADCATLGQGFTGGALACTSTCTLDTSGCTMPTCADEDGDSYSPEGGSCGPVDCDDGDAEVFPTAVEVCGNGVDEDCSGGDAACGDARTYEAEGFALSGYEVETASFYSNGQGVRVIYGQQAGTATAPFDGPSGTYEVDLHYVVESDGQPTLQLSIGASVVGSFSYELKNSGETSLRTRTYGNVSVVSGAAITLTGTKDSGAWARLDKVVFRPLGSEQTAPECSSDAECEDGNVCTSDRCDAVSGCVHDPMPNGTSCDDGLSCTAGESCTGGVCGGGAPLDCSPLGDSCTVGMCIEGVGGCVAQPHPEGTLCDDGKDDTIHDACLSGVCVGEDAALGITSLTASPNPPQPVGTSITFTAVASAGGRPLEYRWWVKDRGQWVMARDWSPSSSYLWEPDRAAPDYQIGVWVRAVGDEQHRSTSMPFPIEAAASDPQPTEPEPVEPDPTEAVEITSLTANPPAPQNVGTSITFTTVASGGGGSLEYRWWIREGGRWSMLQDWSPSSSFVWTPDHPASDYRLGVWVRKQGSPDHIAASIPFPIGATQPLGLTSDRPAPQPAGTSITFTAVGSGTGGSLEYRWWVFEGGTWVMARDWNPAATFVWTPSTPDPSYKVGVWARPVGTEEYEVAAVPFPIHAP